MSRHDLWRNIDLYKRKLFLKNEIKRLFLKALKKNRYLTYAQRYRASFHLTTLPQIKATTSLRNRCYVSGRVHAVDRKTRSSRFVFRRKIYKSDMPGFRRASW